MMENTLVVSFMFTLNQNRMKANELRIGNYVYDTLGKVNKIDLEAITYIVKEPHNQVKPIPLTEEWLLKFGFVESKVSSQFDKEKLTIQVSNELEYHKKGRVYFNSWAILEESIKYVHQLQNLYFALTGEELTFKSE